MLKVLVACANGSGTSLMMKMTAEKALKALGIDECNVHHCSLSEGKSTADNYDLVFCPLNFIDMFKDAVEKGIIVIGIKNVLSESELKQKLEESGKLEELKNK